VLIATGLALVLHLLWFVFLAGSGGDLAAQDAWTAFALAHPSSAYDFAWYGGMHPASYSLVSPYVMSVIGVRTTMVLVGTLSTTLLALLVGRIPSVATPIWPAVYAAAALTGNAVSGRVTFGVGILFGLGALAMVFLWPQRWRRRAAQVGRGVGAVLLAALATAASPVAGLFLGLVAAALWLRKRRLAALAVGAAPVLIVVGTAIAFPFFGIQPISWRTAALPLVIALACLALVPRGWRLGRVCCAVYTVAVLLVWVVPTPIGTNVSRLALVFGGVVLVAAASGRWWNSLAASRLGPSAGKRLLVAAIVTSSVWQVTIASRDVLSSASATGLDGDVRSLVTVLRDHDADLGRVEVVPTKSHREASALAPYVNLARGWNRQADVGRNPLFYRDEKQPLTSEEYRRWLHRWAVRVVVVSTSTPDSAGIQEAELVSGGLPYLQRVWSDPTWTVYEVVHPTALASAPATFVGSDAVGLTVRMPTAGSTVLRIAWSPWLTLVDDAGRRLEEPELAGACLAPVPSTDNRPVSFVVLTVAQPGVYRVAAPYSLTRGTPCPDPAPG
jgi:hypothetical protein